MQINSVGFLDSRLDMAKVAKIIVEYCADVKPGENVIIMSDDAQSENVYTSITAAAAVAGAESNLLLYPTRIPEIAGNRVSTPRAAISCVRDADVVILCGIMLFDHDFYDIVEKGESKARIIMMTGMTEESIIRTIPVDYESIVKETRRLIGVFGETQKVRVTCPMGTQVTIDVSGGRSLGCAGTFKEEVRTTLTPAHAPMEFQPAGRIGTFLGPHRAEGVIKLKSFLGLGLTHGCVSLIVKDSRVVEVKGEGAEQWYVENLRHLLFQDENSNHVCEVGIGLNPAARLTGCYEDYGVQGSVRFGFGWTKEVESVFHSDGFTMGATMELDGTALIRDGEYV